MTIRAVVHVAQSPMNAVRWCLTLMCGHEVWITSRSRPQRKKTNCTQCVGEPTKTKKPTKKKSTDLQTLTPDAVVQKRAPAWTKTTNPKAFASLEGGQPQEEVMLHVYWSALGDARDVREGDQGHRMQRDKVTASLGLDRAPDPGFTEAEMQDITFAAKMAALKCLRVRKPK